MAAITVDEIRKDFPILDTKTKGGKRLVYLDSSATSQKPVHVINAVSDFYRTYNANIHRGMYDIAVKATEEYERSKGLVAEFIKAKSYRNIVYTRNTTESINTVSMSWGDANVKKDDTILITEMEHHANIVPWQLLAKRTGAKLEYAKVKDAKFIDMDDYKEKLGHSPKIVAFTHVSNVLGTINPAKEMVAQAHKAGAKVLVDGAQAVPHFGVDVADLDADFYAFSAHKMLGPSGIGVLYGKEELLEGMEPVLGGGDMIRSVTFEKSTWNELPWKFEAGTANIEGAIGLGAAIEYLNRISMDWVQGHGADITKYAVKRIGEVPGVRIYGPGIGDTDKRICAISFRLEGAHPHDVATILNSEGIAIRAGHHCAMPLVNIILEETAVSRISTYIYNKEEEIDRAVDAIGKVKKVLRLGS